MGLLVTMILRNL